jgi:cytochrome c oxidase cbb3-type subunit III
MNRINTVFKKAILLVFILLSGDLLAAEVPLVPWRNLPIATEVSTFYFLTGLALFLLILIMVLASVLKSLGSNKDLWIKKGTSGKAAGILIPALMLLSSSSGFAQGKTDAITQPVIVMTDDIFWVLVALNVFLLGILAAILLLIRNMLKSLRPEEIIETVAVKQDIWSGSLNAAVPIERESEVMTDHVYDGIRELDNDLPPWWVWGFYFTIVVAIAYFGYYHVTGKGDLPLEEYAKEMAEGQKQKEEYLARSAAKVDEKSVIAFTEAAQVNKGKETFLNFCAACHGRNGEGVVGPNFSDDYWLHGGGIKNIFTTIKYGVPQKGMIAWETQLTPLQIQEVASYILTLRGTNPANAKAPQGEIWNEEIISSQPDSMVADTATIASVVN